MEKQIVYVLTNPAMPNLCKIGKTTQSDVEMRMSQLYSTGVPLPFECAFAVEVEDCSKVETALHVAFGPSRINPKREFFEIDPEQAIAVLKLLGSRDVTPEINEDLNRDVSEAEKESAKRASKRPSINFDEMGIAIGSTLTFADDDDTITVTVTAPKKVRYNGEEVSLTRVTREILGLDYNIQPTKYWLCEGRNLRDIWEETYVEGDF
jgi:hypothetical protein